MKPPIKREQIRAYIREGREAWWIVVAVGCELSYVRRVIRSMGQTGATFPTPAERAQRKIDTTAVLTALRTA